MQFKNLRIKHRENGEANSYSIHQEDRAWLVNMLLNGEMRPEMQQQMLDRLVACWNACLGIETQALAGCDVVKLYRSRLEGARYFVGDRDPNKLPLVAGEFMVCDQDEEDGYCIVGDNLQELILEAHQHLFRF